VSPPSGAATGANRVESTSVAILGPLLPSPPTASHLSPALTVSHPSAPPFRSPVLRSGPPPMSASPGDTCAQDVVSPIPVFAVADATSVGPAATSMDRATAPGEPLPVASQVSPVPRFGYVPSQQCGLFSPF
jgi:hypothetical protein